MRACLLLLASCYAALPPPVPPHIHGAIHASGGTLGTWDLAIARVVPVETAGVDAVDLLDPATPGPVVRLVRVAAEPDEKPRGIVEMVASREVEVRVANGSTEVVLAPDRCTRLDAILRVAGGEAFGTARFDCDAGEAGHVTGDVEIAAGSYRGASVSGHLEASDATLARTRFEPDQGELDPHGVLFWDHRYPRVVFELDATAPDASVLGSGTDAVMRVRSTAASVPSLLFVEHCTALKLARHETGYVRVGTHQHTSWAGSIDVDCETPGGGRLTGNVEVSG